MKNLDKKSYTLLEAMITALIMTAVLAGIYTTFILGNRSWAYYNDSIASKQEVRRALFVMANELREAKNVLIVTEEEAGLRMNFYKPSTGVVSYVWERAGENAHRIIRKNYSRERILANDITNLSFEYLVDSILIEVETTKVPFTGPSMTYRLREKVALRSKISSVEPFKETYEHKEQ